MESSRLILRSFLVFLLFGFFILVPRHSIAALVSQSFFLQEHQAVVEFGMQYLKPDFKRIPSVVIRNPQNSSEASPVLGEINHTYPDTFAQTLHARLLMDEATRTTLDFQSFLPLNGFAQLDTGNTELPEYVLYRVESQRPRVKLMGERNLSDSFRLGLGIDLGFGITSEALISLQSGAGKYSTQRIQARAKPRIIPMAMMEWFGFQFSIKGENKVDFSFDSTAGTSVFGGSAGFEITYDSQSALYYDPWKFDLSRRIFLEGMGLDSWTIEPGVSYQLWSGYQPRSAVIRNVSGTFANGRLPEAKVRNLLVPRISVEKQFSFQRWSISYEFKDSIFRSLPNGYGNFLDPPRHTFWLDSLFRLDSGWEWGLGFQVSRLSPQSVVKSDASEVGAPGYEASGWLYGGSVSLTVPFEPHRGERI